MCASYDTISNIGIGILLKYTTKYIMEGVHCIRYIIPISANYT